VKGTATSTSPTPNIRNRNLLALSLIIIFGVFATTMAQPQVLGRLPLRYPHDFSDRLCVFARAASPPTEKRDCSAKCRPAVEGDFPVAVASGTLFYLRDH